MNIQTILSAILVSMLMHGHAIAATAPKPATKFTKEANEAVQKSLPFNDKQDFEDAQRGFIARPDVVTIKDADGNVVWDLEEYKTFIDLTKSAPPTPTSPSWSARVEAAGRTVVQKHDASRTAEFFYFSWLTPRHWRDGPASVMLSLSKHEAVPALSGYQ